MVTSKYERAVSADGVNCRGTVIDLLHALAIIATDRNESEVHSWTFRPAFKGPCELPA
jgi:hypothetical protein